MYFADTGLPWIPPSPNLPTPASALVYPGQVLWEGTNVSEGRGTTQPFEVFGAPFVDPRELVRTLGTKAQSGVHLRPVTFEPTSGKWSGEPCNGFHLHVTDRTGFRPYLLSLALLQAVCRLYPDDFSWKQPPYEYEYQRMPIDLLIGDKGLRQRLESGEGIESLADSWREGLRRFTSISKHFRLYE